MEDTSTWMTSVDIVKTFMGRRDNDVKVKVNGIPVPITSIVYNRAGDQFEIELFDGDDLKTALAPDPIPGEDT